MPGGCGVPTQECFHVPPEVLVTGGENELLVWSAGVGVCTPTLDENSATTMACAKAEQNQMLPPSAVEPARASVVMRKLAGSN